jgi:hypothetical protein
MCAHRCGAAWQVAETLNYSYVNGERRPVEVLIFQMDPAVVDEFISRLTMRCGLWARPSCPASAEFLFCQKRCGSTIQSQVKSHWYLFGTPKKSGMQSVRPHSSKSFKPSLIHGSHTPSNWSVHFTKSPTWEFTESLVSNELTNTSLTSHYG